jgi:hypothetical protein
MRRVFERILLSTLIFGGLALLPAATVVPAVLAKQSSVPRTAGWGACRRCSCPSYVSGGGACARSSCRHQFGEHVN